MKQEEIIENNKLIAEFMGMKFKDDSDYIETLKEMRSQGMFYEQGMMASELQYDASWDMLMPVVDKCTQIGFRDQEFDNEIYLKWEEIFDDMGMFLGNHIEEVFAAVVEFIKWYNKNLEA